MRRTNDSYRDRFERIDSESVDPTYEYIKCDQYESVLNEIEQEVSGIKTALERYNPRNDTLEDIIYAVKQLSDKLY
jgi:CRISPR/Cas system-associated endonuclease Cas3-HD